MSRRAVGLVCDHAGKAASAAATARRASEGVADEAVQQGVLV